MTETNNKKLASTTDEPVGRMRSQFNLLGSVLGPFLALAMVVLFFAIADDMQEGGGAFMTMRNFRTISVQMATVAVAALGMTVIIIAGGIDLSAGTALALCATVLAWSLKEDVALLMTHGDNVAAAVERFEEIESNIARTEREIRRKTKNTVEASTTELSSLEAEATQLRSELAIAQQALDAIKHASQTWSPFSPYLAVLLAILTGCIAGLINGALVSYLRVVPFIVSLGTMRIYLGVAKEIANETTVRPDKATQVPDWLADLLSIRSKALWMGLPSGVWLTLVLAIILAAVLRYTVFGRYVFALGSNESTARLCGINVHRNKIAVYTLAGFFVGIAGLYQFSRLSVGNPTSGIGLELNIIAAVVIGGGSLNGGRGTVIGTLTGAAVMAVITSGCTQLGLKNPVQDVILGTIIIAAVTLDQIRQRRLAN